MIKKILAEVKSMDDESGSIIGIGSNGAVDRDGDVIEPSGWDFTEFNRNPVFLWAHDLKTPPIGVIERVWVENGEMLFKARFASTSFAQEIRSLYKEGILKTFSVSFNPLEAVDRQVNGQWVGTNYKRQELYEISAVPVPANPDATVIGIKERKQDAVSNKAALDRIANLLDASREVYNRCFERGITDGRTDKTKRGDVQ